jgi:hypothetical protein
VDGLVDNQLILPKPCYQYRGVVIDFQAPFGLSWDEQNRVNETKAAGF